MSAARGIMPVKNQLAEVSAKCVILFTYNLGQGHHGKLLNTCICKIYKAFFVYLIMMKPYTFGT